MRRFKKREGVSMDMTPLIDMVFLLIIFFLIATSFENFKKIEINLPGSETGKKAQSIEHTVTITDKNVLYYNNSKVTLSQLESIVKKIPGKDKKNTVYLNADRKVNYELIIRVMDLFRKYSITNISLGVKSY